MDLERIQHYLKTKIVLVLSIFMVIWVAQEKRPEIKWDPNLPTFAIGDFMMYSIEDFSNFKKDHEIFILAISNSKCESWCQAEFILNDLNGMIKNKQIHYNMQEIPTNIIK